MDKDRLDRQIEFIREIDKEKEHWQTDVSGGCVKKGR